MSKHIHDESDRNKQVKIRASEDLVDEFDEVRDKSRAELFREFMADFVDADAPQSDEIVPCDDELEAVYRWLVDRAAPYDDALLVNFGDVKVDMANKFDTNKGALKRRYLRRLRDEGYIGRPQSGRFVVNPLDVPLPSCARSEDGRPVATDGGGRDV